MIKHIFLDMDGVIVDFVSGVYKEFGIDIHSRPPTSWSIENDIGVTERQMWSKIDGNVKFWHSLKFYEWFYDIIDVVSEYEWSIASKPSGSSASAEGKVYWLQSMFGVEFRDYHLTPNKKWLAASDRILIDDNDKNCNDWIEAGGYAILFPQPWNANSCLLNNKSFSRVKYVKDKLEQFDRSES